MPDASPRRAFSFTACSERGPEVRVEVDNIQIATTLETVGDLLDVLGENAFKVRAYRNAARTIEGLERAAASLAREGKLKELPGVGEGLAAKIDELVSTGKMAYLDELTQKVPIGVLSLLKVQGCGPKKARQLWQELGVADIDALKKACEEGRVSQLKGFGDKMQAKILAGIAFAVAHSGRFRLDQVMPHARRLLDLVASCPGVLRTSLAGSIRRWRETVRDVDILASATDAAPVIEAFAKSGGSILGQGPTKCSIQLAHGPQVDLRVVKDDEFAAALAYFTGSKEHNVILRTRAQKMGLSINEYGVLKGDTRLKIKSEEELYTLLGLAYVPPEMREARGEVEAAESSTLPVLLERKDIQGVFHTHSTWSDGTAEIGVMAEKARTMGLKYMGLSDHSKAAAYAGGLNEERLSKQMKEVDAMNASWSDFRILKGLECDILPDGNLDLTPEILSQLDFVIGSIHSRFDMTEQEMTDRVCKALNNNHLDIFGHPTGRLLLHRDGYKIDLERVLLEAKKARKCIELNANPNRLDLDWIHLKRAKDLGVTVSIGPDAHSPQGLEDLDYGVATARRGWLTAKDVLNTRSAEETLAHFHY